MMGQRDRTAETDPQRSEAPAIWRWLFAGFAAIAYFYVVPYYPQVNNPNENIRLYMTAALVEDHSYQIDTIRKRWGWTNDAAEYEGRHYSVKAPGTSFLGLPAYFAYYQYCEYRGIELDRSFALWLCRVTASAIPCFAFALWFAFWLRRRGISEGVALLAAASVAIGSNYYAYALMFVSHSICAASAFVGFALLYDQETGLRQGKWAAFAAGIFVAGATFFEYPGVIVSFVLSLYAVYVYRANLRSLVPYVVGAAIPALLMMHFQWRCFGSPFRPGHHFVETKAFRAAHAQGFFGANEFHADAAWKLLVHPYYGLFFFTPLAILGVYAVGRALKERPSRASTLAVLTSSLLLYFMICLMNNWDGGWSIGPRYLVTLVPFAVYLAALGADRLLAADARGRFVSPAMVLGLAGFSFVVSGIAGGFYPHVPPEITWPIPQLYEPIIRSGLVPPNLGNFAGLSGAVSMIPWWLAILGIFLLVSARLVGDRKRALLHVIGGAAIAATALGAYVASSPPMTKPGADMLELVTSHWASDLANLQQ